MHWARVILVMGLLLLRGVVVPHTHAHEGFAQPTGHANRPHTHIFPNHHFHDPRPKTDTRSGHSRGHSHSHGARHRHSHSHAQSHQNSELPLVPAPRNAPVDSPQSIPEHDQDAVYTDQEPIAATSGRIVAPEPVVAEWFISVCESENKSLLIQMIELRSAGPPGNGIPTSFELLPHLLRL